MKIKIPVIYTDKYGLVITEMKEYDAGTKKFRKALLKRYKEINNLFNKLPKKRIVLYKKKKYPAKKSRNLTKKKFN